ncbi:hypothetical protein V7150_12255 [Neobacillus drentensis]|uniref:hypothetical protein n=1 Tax=Neobacillus drentensis TaxID=220684 RepID=UPI003000ADBC
MEITSANINKKNPMSVDVHTYKGEEITQTIDKSPKKVMIIGSAVAELIVKFEQQEKVVGFAYSDQTDSKFAEEIEKLPLVRKMWPSKELNVSRASLYRKLSEGNN